MPSTVATRAGEAIDLAINALTLAGSAAALSWFWRRRAALLRP